MPIQTAEADKRLPADENSGFADAGLLRSGDSPALRQQAPTPDVRIKGYGSVQSTPPASHGVSQRKNIPVKFFGWSTLFGVPRSGQLAVWALIDHWPKNSKR